MSYSILPPNTEAATHVLNRDQNKIRLAFKIDFKIHGTLKVIYAER